MRPQPRRTTRTVGYTLMAIAGVAALIWPAPSVREATSPAASVLVYVWAALLTVGGLCSAAGAATDRWLGEYAGLWPLVTTFAVFALAAAASGRLSAIAGACVLGAFAMILLARWRDVALIRREATARYHAERGGR